MRYDDFTIDIAENQLVKAAAVTMQRIPGLDPLVARRLRAIIHRLDEVGDLVPGRALPAWRSSRRTAHYETTLWFASIILRHRSVDLPTGDVVVNGFMIDMATVFEDFVTAALGDALTSLGGRVAPQDHRTLDTGDVVDMRPDLVWYRHDQPVAVVDAKYKAEKPAGYPNADLYQLLAYCTALGLSCGHLLYAKGNEPAQRYTVRGSLTQLHVHAVDLELQPTELLVQVDAIAGAIRNVSVREVAPTQATSADTRRPG